MVAIAQEPHKVSSEHGKSGWVEEERAVQPWNLELSIPGTKYLFEKNTSKTHRFLWSIVLLGAFVGMSVVIGFRIFRLLQCPKSVNVNMAYNSSVIFPTITICNKNMFTASKIYTHVKMEHGEFGDPFSLPDQLYVFQFLTDYFTYLLHSHDHSSLSVEEYRKKYKAIIENGPEDFNQFYNNSVQDIQNMIVECSWKGQPCGPQNFTKLMTDHGFCYAFNEDAARPFTTEAAGPRGGLRLVLNAETYDLLASWDMSAGFLVGISHPNETTQVIRDLALQVSPGMQTYMGIRVSEFHEMYDVKRPTCSVQESLLICNHKCHSAYVIEKCGCKEVSMIGDGVKVCSPYDMVSCSARAIDELVQFENYTSYCNCRPACHRVAYDVTVTQSAFSEFGTAVYSLRNGDIDDRLESLFKIQDLSFLNAMVPEASHRLMFEVNDRTKFLINHEFFSEISQCTTHVSNVLQEMIKGGLEQNISSCIKSQINLSNEIIQKFSKWIGGSYFTTHTLKKGFLDDFLVLVTHDLLRKKYRYLTWLDEIEAFVMQANDSAKAMSSCFDGNVSQTMGNAISDCFDNHNAVLIMTDVIRNAYLNINKTIAGHETISNLPERPQKMDKTWYKENYAFVDIFLEHLTVMQVVQNPDDNMNSFICDIGGSIGLYLGGSLLTLMEILDLIIWVCYKRERRPKVIQVAEKIEK